MPLKILVDSKLKNNGSFLSSVFRCHCFAENLPKLSVHQTIIYQFPNDSFPVIEKKVTIFRFFNDTTEYNGKRSGHLKFRKKILHLRMSTNWCLLPFQSWVARPVRGRLRGRQRRLRSRRGLSWRHRSRRRLRRRKRWDRRWRRNLTLMMGKL